MEILVKYNFLINSSKFTELSFIEDIFYYINFINTFLSYCFVFKFIIELFINYKIEFLLLSSFYGMDLFLYYYINSIHIKKVINSNITLILTDEIKSRLKMLLIFNLLISLIIASIFTILLNKNFKFYIFDNNWNKGINSYFIFFLSFYSLHLKLSLISYFLIFINNLINISSNFIKLIKLNNLDVNNLIQQYLGFRHKYNGIIFVFNNIISSIISFSLLPSLFLILNKFNLNMFDFMYICNFIFFCIFCIFFHYSSSIIDDNIKYLKSLNDKNINIKEYIHRKKNLYNIQIDNNLSNIDSNELNFKNFILDIENANSLDWLIYSNILNQNLRKIEILGIEISNSNIITKIISLFVFIIIGKQII